MFGVVLAKAGTQYPETPMIEPRSRGVLGRPVKPDDDSRGRSALSLMTLANKNAADHPYAFDIPQTKTGNLFLVVLLLAADRFQLGEHRVHVEVVALFFGRLEF